MNRLYYGDNLDILREHIPDESVDLIYLDPPFNSKRSYNVLFKEANGTAADSQIQAFDDTWGWGATAEATLREIEMTGRRPAARFRPLVPRTRGLLPRG